MLHLRLLSTIVQEGWTTAHLQNKKHAFLSHHAILVIKFSTVHFKHC